MRETLRTVLGGLSFSGGMQFWNMGLVYQIKQQRTLISLEVKMRTMISMMGMN